MLRRKWTLHAHGRPVVFIKKRQGSSEHVLMKAFLWALYLPEYPQLQVEVAIAGRYKPDVVQLDSAGSPRFWGEAGQVGMAKIEHLARRYPDTHIVIGKWSTRLEPLVAIVTSALTGARRRAPFDLVRFPADSVERFVAEDGTIRLAHADLEWRRFV